MGFNNREVAGRPLFLFLLSLLALFVIPMLSFGGQAEAAPSPPTVQTDATTRDLGFAPKEYILNGQITGTGGEECDERGFDYRKQGDEAWTSWTETGSFGTGAFSSDNLAGLEAGAVYAVVAKAHNSAGWGYGETLTFRIIGVPEMTTDSSSDITSSSATLHGTLVDDGGEACWRRGFYYRKVAPVPETSVYQDGSFTPNVALSDGFEDGDLDPFTTEGDIYWSVTDQDFYTAPYAAVSGGIGDGQISILRLEVDMSGEGTVRFARKVSSEEGRDFLAFFIDDVEQDEWSGEVAWAQVSYPLEKGPHALEWRYEKDGGNAAGDDSAWVDAVYASSPASYSITATGLEPGTTYEFWAYAVNMSNLGHGGSLSFTTDYVVPTVRTDPATAVTGDAATLNGYVLNPGGQYYDGRGFDYREKGETEWQEYTDSAYFTGSGAFSGSVSGLDPNADYEFRAKAHNAAGWGYGSTVTLHTLVEPPLVQTDPATDVTHNSATLNATITYTGGEDCDFRAIVYRKQGTTMWTPWQEEGAFGTGVFSVAINGLDAGTPYEFYCYAHNSVGTAYGSTLTFTTLDVPGVSTLEESDVVPESATLNGEITSTGGADCDERGFDYRAKGETTWQSWTEAGTFGTGTFSWGLTGLSPGSFWEFRAKAHNQVGWGYGDIESLETPPVPPSVATCSATGISGTWAQLNGEITDTGGRNCDYRGFDYRMQGEEEWQEWTEYREVVFNQIDGWGGGYGTGTYSHVLTDIESGATYEFRAKAHNHAGWTYGDVLSFTTLYAPVMHTDPATGVDTDSAILHGEILDTGGDDCGFRGFQLRQQGETDWTDGWSEYESTYPAGPYSHEIDGLSPGTDYEYRAYASNWCGYGYGEIAGFRTAVLPQARSDPATGIGTTTATLNGCIVDAGGENCDQRGFEYRVQGETTWQEWTEAGSFPTGLCLEDGFEDGELLPFRTGWLAEPWVHDDATAYTGSWSMRSGAIGDDGKSNLYTYMYDCSRISFARKVSSEEGCDFLVLYEGEIEIGHWSGALDWEVISLDLPQGSHEFRFQYEKDGSLSAGSDCAWVDDVVIDSPFSHGLDGLLPATTYEFRAKAQNTAGWGYGGTLTFTTQGIPEVGTSQATGIVTDSATLNGEIEDQGASPCDWRGFEYRPQGQDHWDEWTEGGALGEGTYSHTLTGLVPGTGYSFRAKAHNTDGWGYGETLSFTTAKAPVMETDDATSITSSSAVLGGAIADTGGEACSTRGFQYRVKGEDEWQKWEEAGSFAPDRIGCWGFEDGAVSSPFQTGQPPQEWYAEESGCGAFNGAFCARSPYLGDKDWGSAHITLVADVPDDGYLIRFARRVSSEESKDFLFFHINMGPGNMEPVEWWSGEVPWGTEAYEVPAGHNEFYWWYKKDPGHAGEDAAWIDDVVLENTVPYSHELTGLQMNTTYEFRSMALDTHGWGYGDPVEFTTADYPTVWTNPATWISPASARLNGRIYSTGGQNCDCRGFEYRAQGDSTWQEWVETGDFVAEEYGGVISGLEPNRAYEFRAKAHNSAGWVYGDILAFTTPAAVPVVETRPATGLGEEAATLGGDIKDIGGDDCDRRGFDYRKQGDSAWTSRTEAGSFGTGAFSLTVDGLETGSTYEYRAKADNSGGWGYGEVKSFTTEASAASTWYLAEGSTDWGFDCYVSIMNPNPEAVSVKVTYMTSTGPVPGPTVAMTAQSQATVFPRETLGAADFSTRVECVEGKSIAVDRTMYWTGPSAQCAEAHCASGVTSPDTTWYMPEGSTAWGFECYLLIQNPGDAPASCDITWMIQGKDPVVSPVTVPGSSRATYNMADFIGAEDASIRVTSGEPVICERAMYRNNRREGHDSGGTTNAQGDYYLAEGCSGFGFTTYVLIQNPQDTPTEVTVTYQAVAGPVPGPSFVMPPNSRHTICVNDSTQIPGPDPSFSTHVHGSAPIICERAMYWRGGPDAGEACHDSIGLSAPHTAWFLADGQSSEGRETFILVQNPGGEDVQVEITYMTPTGTGNVVRGEIIPAGSRRTFNLAEHAGITGRAAIRITCGFGKKVMCERAMYWNSRGAGTDTIGAYSD